MAFWVWSDRSLVTIAALAANGDSDQLALYVRRGMENGLTRVQIGETIAQTAAEMMGVPLDKVEVRLGDSSFPTSAGSGGQWGGNCSTAGVYAACMKLREAVAQKLGFNAADVVFAEGEVRSGGRSMPLAAAAGEQGLVAEDAIEFGE